MARVETWVGCDLDKAVQVRQLGGFLFTQDNEGNLLGAKVTQDGEPVNLTGTVVGYAILSDGQTVDITGDSTGIQNGNEAYIILPQLAYSVPGQISIVIKLTTADTITTLAAFCGYVYRSKTGNEVVPPGTPIPDLSTLEEAIRNANTAAAAANTAAAAAENVDISMSQDGDAITITTTDRQGETKTATFTDQSEAVSELKSAFEQLNDNVITESAGPAPIISVTDGADGMPMRKVEVAIESVQDLHGYDAPWPAGGSTNKFSGQWPPDVSGSYAGWQTGATRICSLKIFDKGNGADITGVYFGLSVNGTNTPVVWAVDNGAVRNEVVRTGESFATDLYPYVVLYPNNQATLTKILNRFNVMVAIDGESVDAYAPYSNICPITGWTGAKVTRTGKNLLNIDRQVGTPNPTDLSASPRVMSDSLMYVGIHRNNYYYNGNVNSYSIENGTITVNSKNNSYGLGFPVSVKPSTTYTLSATKTDCIMSVGQYDAEWNFISSIFVTSYFSQTFTTADNASFIVVIISSNTINTNGTAADIQLELGSTATAYEPYQGQTYEVTFPTSAGTVYGGTLDVVSGKLVVDRAVVDLGTLTWSKATASTYTIFYTEISGKALNTNFVCSAYKNAFNIRTNLNNCEMGVFNTNSESSWKRVVIRDDAHANDTVEQFKTAMSGVQLVYELAQTLPPITLTPTEIKTLLGINNVWVDAGNTSIAYPADTKMYIDNRINSTRKLIAGIETGFVASKAYAVGDMLIIGDDLYKVASSIASGATITVGTNVTKTTVAEQLLALANA